MLFGNWKLEVVDKGARAGGDFDFFHAVYSAVVAVSGVGLAEVQ